MLLQNFCRLTESEYCGEDIYRVLHSTLHKAKHILWLTNLMADRSESRINTSLCNVVVQYAVEGDGIGPGI